MTARKRKALTEQTGKGWKFIQLAGMLLVTLGIVGSVAVASGSSVSNERDTIAASWLVLSMFGFVVMVFGRAGAWWFYG